MILTPVDPRDPPCLCAVELLKTASSSLGIGPAYAMQVAERLYTQVSERRGGGGGGGGGGEGPGAA